MSYILSLKSSFGTGLLGHVNYVTTLEERAQFSGADLTFLKNVFNDPLNFALIAATIIGFLLIYKICSASKPFAKKIQKIKEKAKKSEDLIGWMIRLSLGIALIGAGSHQALISESLKNYPHLSLIQIATGFMLMAGFLIPLNLVISIGLYFVALIEDSYILGNLDFLALAIAGLILANSRPGVDDLLDIPFISPLKKAKKYLPLVLRISIGTALTFLAIFEKFLNPNLFKVVVEKFHLTSAIPVSVDMWTFSVGTIELLLGLCLIFGYKTRLTAAIAIVVLSGSFFYFQEAVYSHITLFGILSILFLTGSGKKFA